MKNFLVFIFSFLVIIELEAQQNEWNLKINKDGIRVYNLKNDTSKFKSLKVETFLNTSSSDLVAIITDIKNHQEWVYGTKLSYELKKLSEYESYFYKEVRSPLPLANRDLIAHLKISKEQDKSVKIETEAAPHYLKEKEGLVRVPLFKEVWHIIPFTDQLVKVEYFLKVDPGGYVPPVLVNLFATKGPYQSFVNLTSLVKERKRK